jgi:hypothetical protein
MAMETRRRVRFEQAITDSRERISQLERAARSIANNDYAQIETIMRDGLVADDGQTILPGLQEIQNEISQAYTSDDPWLQQQWNEQWIGIESAASENFREIAFQKERTYYRDSLVIAAQNDVWNGTIEQAHGFIQDKVDTLVASGLMTDAQGFEFGQQLTQQLNNRLHSARGEAVAARSREGVEELWNMALRTGIVKDEDFARREMAKDMYAIHLSEVRSAVFAQPNQEAALSMMLEQDLGISEDDWSELFGEVDDRLQWKRREQQYRIDQADTRSRESANELEQAMIRGDVSWTEGLRMLQETQLEGGEPGWLRTMKQATNEHFKDRWTAFAAAEEAANAPGSRYADPSVRQAEWIRLYQMIQAGTPESAVQSAIFRSATIGEDGMLLLNMGEMKDLMNYNGDRSQIESAPHQAIKRILDDDYKDLPRARKEEIEATVLMRLGELSFDPEGNERTTQEKLDLIEQAVHNLAEPQRAINNNNVALMINEGGVTAFGRTVERGNDGSQGRRIETLRTQLQDNKVMVGTVQRTRMMGAVLAGQTDEDVLKSIFQSEYGLSYDDLTNEEQKIVDNHVSAIRMAAEDVKLFTAWTGQEVSRSNMALLDDGTVGFIAAFPNGEQRLVRVAVRDGEETWQEYTEGMWAPSDVMNELSPAEGTRVPAESLDEVVAALQAGTAAREAEAVAASEEAQGVLDENQSEAFQARLTEFKGRANLTAQELDIVARLERAMASGDPLDRSDTMLLDGVIRRYDIRNRER